MPLHRYSSSNFLHFTPLFIPEGNSAIDAWRRGGMFTVNPFQVKSMSERRHNFPLSTWSNVPPRMYIWGVGGSKRYLGVVHKRFKLKVIMKWLTDNTRGLITTKQTKLRPVASATLHPITPNKTNKAQASRFCSNTPGLGQT